MSGPFIIVKAHKSVGIAILLTFIFGPLGLFYASVSGGLTMTFTPILLLIFLVVGFLKESSLLLGWSFVLLVFFGLTFWLINIIWAIVSVRSYNKDIDEDAKRQQDIWNKYHEKDHSQVVININHKTNDTKPLGVTTGQGSIEVATKHSLQDWLKANPGKSINDYFSKHGK